jgi:hypothetical protein
LTIFAQTAPGCAGLTVGENDGPAGPTAFSVGVFIEGISDVEGISEDGACDVDGAVVDGASFSLVLHAVNVPIPIMAAPPTRSAI